MPIPRLQSDGIPFKPGQVFDPTVEQTGPLVNVEGKSLAETNTPAQITAAGGVPLVASSSSYRSDVTDLGGDITKMLGDYGIEKPDESAFDKGMADYTKTITDREAEIAKRNEEDKAGINADYTNAEGALKLSQEDALAKAEGRTRIGGFFTQLEAKDIINMQSQHRLEIAALTSKKNDALQAANRAYQDEDYKLAKDLRDEAKAHEKDIYDRKKDFYNFVTKAAEDKRTATKAVRDDANSRIETITKGIQDGTIDPNNLNPGERAQLMKDAGFDFDIFDKIAEQAKNGQVVGSPHIDTKTGAVNLLIKKQDGTYEYKKVGQVAPSNVGTEADNKRVLDQKKASALSEAQTIFSTQESAGGLAGTDGKIDAGSYRATMQLFADKHSMTPKQFMTEFPPERFLSSESLKKNSDLTISKAGSGGSADPATIEIYAKQWADYSVTNPLAIPADMRDEVFKRASEIRGE